MELISANRGFPQMSESPNAKNLRKLQAKNAHRKSYFCGHKTYSALIINDNQLWVNQNENRNNAEKYSTVAVARTAVSSLGKLIFCIDMDLRFERHSLVSPHRSGIGQKLLSSFSIGRCTVDKNLVDYSMYVRALLPNFIAS